MKRIRVIFLFFVLLTGIGCEKEDSSTVCGVENPFVNVAWLKELKEQIENNSEVSSAKIVLYRLDNTDYVYVHEIYQSKYDAPNPIFDCNGVEQYVCGGNQSPGLDSCSTFFNKAQRIETL